ncbi:DUF3365 domain-containing protein [Thiorhodococcus mannitoliphagus]|uniref:DUF3365 domain-containing protein n=1 Tax=Thiorhodococcus mannitoliphagus TaxID=329406 RepID=A0A6P1DXP7_9GAMM|nr:DUF3365 domain-containing protein [Thiorhodococcus mannitoliphagus]NEX22250.1 DUF3365 domain-containing protein [Thiorhodococcus mannitoliphagus]
MKTAILITASAASLLFAFGAPKAADEAPANPNVAEAKGIIKQFGGQLVSELKAAIKSGGPEHAIGVCHKRAPAIAKGLSKSSGWDVSRVSLKVRNKELGTPDAWETAVLEKFESRKAAGEDVETMAYAEVVEGPEGKQFRFMKAVPTQEICLACHGTEVTEEVAAKLDEHYPEDQARGFSAGDIRGAFSLSKPL